MRFSACRSKMNEKYTVMNPFDITTKILGPYLFSATARESLGDKMDLYFQDHSFVPLFMQVRLVPYLEYCVTHARTGKLHSESASTGTELGWTRKDFEAARVDGPRCFLDL